MLENPQAVNYDTASIKCENISTVPQETPEDSNAKLPSSGATPNETPKLPSSGATPNETLREKPSSIDSRKCAPLTKQVKYRTTAMRITNDPLGTLGVNSKALKQRESDQKNEQKKKNTKGGDTDTKITSGMKEKKTEKKKVKKNTHKTKRGKKNRAKSTCSELSSEDESPVSPPSRNGATSRRKSAGEYILRMVMKLFVVQNMSLLKQ